MRENSCRSWLLFSIKLTTCLSACVATLSPQLVNLRLCNVSSFFCLIQLMLQLAELGQIAIGLFLLKITTWLIENTNMPTSKDLES